MEELKLNIKDIGRLKDGVITVAGITLFTGDVDLFGIVADLITNPESCRVDGDCSICDRPGPNLLFSVVYGNVHMDEDENPRLSASEFLNGRRTYVLCQPEVGQTERAGRDYGHYVYPPKQLKIVDELVSLFNKGMRVIVLSNSDYILLGLRMAVKRGLLQPSDLSIVYFQDDGKEIEHVYIRTDRNASLECWPTGFFDTFDKCLMELL